MKLVKTVLVFGLGALPVCLSGFFFGSRVDATSPAAVVTLQQALTAQTSTDLQATPGQLDFVLSPYTQETQSITLENTGPDPIDWSIREIPGIFAQSQSVTSSSSNQTSGQGGPQASADRGGGNTVIDWSRPHAPDSLIVGFRPLTTQSVRVSVHGAVGTNRRHAFRYQSTDVVEIPPGRDIESVAAAYAARPEVAYVEPNYLVRLDQTFPNDSQFDLLWGLHNTGQTGGTPDADIDAPEAWSLQTGNHSVIVAVLDTGIDYTHPDLVDNLWHNESELAGAPGVDDDLNGIVDDFYGARWTGGFGNATNGDPWDGHGHGTHVSGTVGGVGNNGFGVAGVNWSVQIMALKFIRDDGFGETADAISALEYALDHGATISNNSWGDTVFSQALRDAIQAAGAAGHLFVASAGNEGTDNDLIPHYPSGYDLPEIISVASSDHNDNKSGFSQYGATTVDLAAPGTDVYSTWPGGGYVTISGTSMASPHVSGVAALLKAHVPEASPLQIKQWILDSVDLLPAFELSGFSPVLSEGRLNAAGAMELAGASWLTETPTAGTLMPGASVVIDVTADATGLTDGFLDSAMLEISGDPAGPVSVGVTLGVVELVHIVHTPLTDTTAQGPYGVCADITAESGIVQRATLFWSDDGGSSFVSTPMGSAGGATFCADIPDRPVGTDYCYYIEAEDDLGNVETHPLSFPGGLHCFQKQGIPNLAATIPEGDLNFMLQPGAAEVRSVFLTNDGDWPVDWSIGESTGVTVLVLPETTAEARTDGILPASHGARGRPALRQVLDDARTSAIASDVLLLAAGADPVTLHTALEGFADINSVDYMDASLFIPTLNDLLPYDVVIVMSNPPFANPTVTGDVLADYVDGGGRVIEAMASFATGSSWELAGRYVNGGYSAFTHGDADFNAHSLGSFDATHPIMEGIGSVSDQLPAFVGLAPGAQWVADWDNGTPVVATQGDHSVAINIFAFDEGTWAGDVPLLFHNAIVWLNRGWLDQAPNSGSLQPGETVEILVEANAEELPDGFVECRDLEILGDPDGPLALQACVTVNASISIAHTPLPDTMNTTGPYDVCASIVADAGLDPATVELHYSVNGGAFQIVPMSNTGGDTYCGDIPGQPDGSVVDYYIAASDLTGSSATSPPSAPAELHSFRVFNPQSGVLLSEDFEAGLGGFTVVNDPWFMWHLTTFCKSTDPGHSATTALWFGVPGTCDYNLGVGAQGSVHSPSVSLLGAADATLSFNYYLQTEGSPALYDQASVSISADGGPFTLVAHNNPGKAPLTLADPSGTWRQATIDLAPWLGSEIVVRFTFNSVDGFSNSWPGFYVDDVQIVAGDPPADITPPVITLNGDSEVSVECGIETYTELGATATDDIDPSVTVIIGGDTVDDTTPGTYIVTYNATDSSGNAATEVIRTVTVEDTTPPVITLNGPAEMTLIAGVDTYVEEGASATDACDPSVTVVIGGDAVDDTTPGTYVVTYDATDAAGNPALQVTRTVTVEDAPTGSPDPDVAAADHATGAGNVTGSYLDTHMQDDVPESLEEQSSGGKKQDRYDSLDHVWRFDLTSGNHLFHADAHYVDGGDADAGFLMEWSTSASGPWTTMFIVSNTSDTDSYQSFDFGAATGTVYVRAVDTNDQAGQNSNDVLHVDHMYVDGGAPPTDPPSPATNPTPGDGAVGVGTNVQLTWFAGMDATSHNVYFGVDPDPDAGEFQGNQLGAMYDPGALANSTTYYWRIDEVNGAGTTTGTVWSFTTADPSPGPTSVHVDAIGIGTNNLGQGLKQGTASVTVVDNEGTPVPNVTVTVSFSGDFNESVAGVTNASGVATVVTIGAKKGKVSLTACVDNVSGATLPYAPADNVVTCATL